MKYNNAQLNIRIHSRTTRSGGGKKPKMKFTECFVPDQETKGCIQIWGIQSIVPNIFGFCFLSFVWLEGQGGNGQDKGWCSKALEVRKARCA